MKRRAKGEPSRLPFGMSSAPWPSGGVKLDIHRLSGQDIDLSASLLVKVIPLFDDNVQCDF